MGNVSQNVSSVKASLSLFPLVYARQGTQNTRDQNKKNQTGHLPRNTLGTDIFCTQNNQGSRAGLTITVLQTKSRQTILLSVNISVSPSLNPALSLAASNPLFDQSTARSGRKVHGAPFASMNPVNKSCLPDPLPSPHQKQVAAPTSRKVARDSYEIPGPRGSTYAAVSSPSHGCFQTDDFVRYYALFNEAPAARAKSFNKSTSPHLSHLATTYSTEHCRCCLFVSSE